MSLEFVTRYSQDNPVELAQDHLEYHLHFPSWGQQMKLKEGDDLSITLWQSVAKVPGLSPKDGLY